MQKKLQLLAVGEVGSRPTWRAALCVVVALGLLGTGCSEFFTDETLAKPGGLAGAEAGSATADPTGGATEPQGGDTRPNGVSSSPEGLQSDGSANPQAAPAMAKTYQRDEPKWRARPADPRAVAELSRIKPRPTAQGKPPGVVLVSVDGLAPRYIDAELEAGRLPTFYWLQQRGAFTHNARAEARTSVTLPNHTSMVTGRPAVAVPTHDPSSHHGIVVNYDLGEGQTIHNAGNPELSYAASVFDEVHDRGGYTSLYAGKSKFLLMVRSYVGSESRVDSIGEDDGRDKVDDFAIEANTSSLVREFTDQLLEGAQRRASTPLFAMLHLRDTDATGHEYGWGSEEYLTALRAMDAALSEVVAVLRNEPALQHLHLLVTSDHGGTERGHSDATLIANARIPFYVWGPTISAGADLYALTDGTRVDPGETIPMDDAGTQPIRNGDAANLGLSLMGLPEIEGSLHRGMTLEPAPVTP